jgi:hypothetical protein
MKAHKLVRLMKDGSLSSLFIGKKQRLPIGEWLESECIPTKGFAVRPGWHCTKEPIAPHLSKKDRVWVKVEIKEYSEFLRPENQGGLWYLAKRMKILGVVEMEEK